MPCSRAEAEALNGDIAVIALMEPPPVLMTHEPDETQPDAWEAHAYFEGKPDDASIALIRALIPSAAKRKPRLERLPDADWVTISQQGLEPVRAGRFYVHASTDTDPVPPGLHAFTIDASLAFGTGNHATTAGCLTLLDRIAARGQRFREIADIGTGTGLLAFAAAHLWPRAHVTATDIDPASIAVAQTNAAINTVKTGRARGAVTLLVASGLDHPTLRARQPYDLIIANILAGPLIELAPAFANAMADGGTLILAGLLDWQRDAVIAAHARVGFRCVETRAAGDWPALRLIKRPQRGWKRPIRTSGRTSQPPGDFGTW